MAQQLVSLDTRNKIKALLREKAKAQRPLTVEDVLKSIRSSVNRMFKRGFDYSDVVTALSEYSVSVSVEIIEAFYAPTKLEKGKRKSQRKPEKAPELEQPVSKEQLEEIVARFRELSNSRKGFCLQELVGELEKEIAEDLVAGWDYEDIARWMKEDFAIDIAPGTLKRYYLNLKRSNSPEERKSPSPAAEPEPEKQKRGEPTAKPKRLKELEKKDQLEKEFNL